MPNWKKVIVSGSNAHLNHVTASGHVSASSTSTGSFGRIEADAFDVTTFTSTTVESTNISGSSTSTGSFGRVHVVGNAEVDGQLNVDSTLLLNREPIQGFNYLARLAEGEVSASAKAHTFTALAQTKSANHPYKNLGSTNGYIIDGVETPFLYLTEGHYKFDYSNASSHPIRFYFDAAKTTQYNPASHVSVDGNVITLKIDKDSPQIIYYQCSSHGYMGWAIHTGQNPLGQDENGLRTLFSGSAQITHDDTTGFVANEHIDHSSVTLTAGTGLSGGGDITTNRSFAVDFTDSTLQSNISGSFSQAHLSSKISGIVSGAIQIEDDISGSLSNSAIAALGAGIVSASSIASSAQGEVTLTTNGLAATAVDLGLKTDDDVKFADGTFTEDLGVSGSLTVAGTITAQEFKTEFISSSIIFTSGSTVFGNSMDDNHVFSGSVDITGSLEATTITADSFSGIFTGAISSSEQIADNISGSFSQTHLSSKISGIVSGAAQIADEISGSVAEPSGNVSGSSVSTGSFGKLLGDGSDLTNLPSAAITSYGSTGNNRVITSVNSTNVQGEENLTFDGTSLTLTGQLTSSGNISSSVTSTGSFGSLMVGGGHFTSASLASGGSGGGSDDNLGDHTATQNLDLDSNSIINVLHITASGNISGSSTSTGSFGYITGSFQGDGSQLTNVAANITVKEEGTNLTTELSSIDFVGDGLTATTDGNNVTVTQDLTQGAGDAATITISTASDTWAVTHSLQNKYPTVTIYDENNQVIIPESITADTINTATITFEQAVSGRASFTLGIPTSSFFLSSSTQLLDEIADSTISGDLNVTGTLTAQEFHTEVTSASIIFTSGSTIFGDSSDDVHNMTGSLNITGSLTLNNGTLTVTDNVDFNGDLDVDGTTNLDVVDIDGAVDMASNLTISGNITGSSTSTGSFGEVVVGGMSKSSMTSLSSSLAARLATNESNITTLNADIIALSIALG